MADEILALSLTCTKCGHTVQNDMPEIKDALQFMDALRTRGWFIGDKEWYHPTQKCDRCASSS